MPAGETEERPSAWTIDTLSVHFAALRAADKELQEERDRRYTEVNIEREKALKIKEEADKAALGLAREIQTYKDEKANQLREQINSERGVYATKEQVQAEVKPLVEYVQAQTGSRHGLDQAVARLIGAVLAGAAIATLVVALAR